MTHPSSSHPDHHPTNPADPADPADPANSVLPAAEDVTDLGPDADAQDDAQDEDKDVSRSPTPAAGSPSPRRLTRVVGAVVTAVLLVAASAGPAVAAPPASLDEVISRITTWIVRLAVGLATLFITYGAVRLLTAGGDPGAAEKAKAAIRGAAFGYLLALLAPLIVGVLSSFVS